MIPGFRERSLFVRDAQGSGLVEAFVIIGILTILLTRAYLHLTGYPQVGGSSLHIAHVLWGGLGMIVALVTVFSFLGRKPRVVAVVVGGIGFGLFLDEIGKFVTKTNDYFYRPSVAIMYVVIVVLLLLNRWLHDVRPPTVTEDVANAAAIALGGLDRGLDRVRREQAIAQLRRAGEAGADASTVACVADLLDRCPDRQGRVMPSVRELARRATPEFARGPGMLWTAAVGLTVFSTLGLISAVTTLDDDLRGAGADITTVGQLVGSAIAFVLCWSATVRLRNGKMWPLQFLRSAALVTVLLTEVFDFVAQEFGALLNVAVGLGALIVFSARIAAMDRARAADLGNSAATKLGPLPPREPSSITVDR
ncbi:hypothetical protein L1080_023230 [Rhodococcus sp. MSC1_016]|jgi:hypothetical protein|uniref:hypothetical protein n=1 Tax=Rhodococcus sp. MSC1_016 TaxID=2909266 RepID=UPI00202F6B1C|nr:hypothetical protein [Rhodococcus sp. MSC1_016]